MPPTRPRSRVRSTCRTTSPRRGRAAPQVSSQNGYTNGVNATVVANQEPQPSRIRVTVTSTTTNFFAGLVGYNNETISRDAVADFQGPVPMGSPNSELGQDPDECVPARPGSCANFWLNTSGPAGTKQEGDRFATGICNSGSVAGCNGSLTNPEYKSDGYTFRVRVTSVQAGQPLVIQVYDPAWMYTEDFCNNANMPTDLQQNNIPNLTGLAVEHHERGAERPRQHHPLRHERRRTEHQQRRHPLVHWRPERRRRRGQHQQHELHHPPARPLAVGRHRQRDRDFVGVRADVLPGHQPADAAAARPDERVDRRDVREELLPPMGHGLFHPRGPGAGRRLHLAGEDQLRHLGPHRCQAAPSRPGRSPATAAASVGNSNAGYNRYALRAGWGTSSGTTGQMPDGTGVSISATRDLPIYANAGADTTPTFYLARVTPTAGSGRTLALNFYDIGDVGSGSVTMQILAPTDSNYSGGFPTCTYHRDNALTEVTAAGCTIPGMTSGVYNGRLVTMTIPIPSNYTCTFASQYRLLDQGRDDVQLGCAAERHDHVVRHAHRRPGSTRRITRVTPKRPRRASDPPPTLTRHGRVRRRVRAQRARWRRRRRQRLVPA